jgi:hypothetical protein
MELARPQQYGCGDKNMETRGWEEVRLALTNIVAAARRVRDNLQAER